jgi:hypothetical protein
LAILPALVCLLLAGCSRHDKWEDDSDSTTDTVTDTVDAGTDPLGDPPVDTGWDPGPDSDAAEPPVDVLDSPVDPTVDVPPDEVTGGVLGDPCSVAGDCMGVSSEHRDCLLAMSETTFTNGYCSNWCDSDMNCDTGGRCVNLYVTMHFCFKACSTPSECRTAEGYTCRVIPYSDDARTYCFPGG